MSGRAIWIFPGLRQEVDAHMVSDLRRRVDMPQAGRFSSSRGRQCGLRRWASRYCLPLILPVMAAGQYLEATIPIGTCPRDALWNPIENRVYCSNQDDNALTVIDGATNEVVDIVHLPAGPAELVWSARLNRLYCSCPENNAVVAVDCAADTVLAVSPTGAYPYSMAVSESSNKLYVACMDADEVLVVDAVTCAILAAIPTPRIPERVAWSRVANRVFCSAGMTDTVFAIDCRADSLVGRMSLGPHPSVVEVSPRSGVVYATVRYGVCALSRLGDSLLSRMPVDEFAMYSASWASNPDRLFVGGLNDGQVYTVDCQTQVLVDSVPVGTAIKEVLCDTVHDKVYCADYYYDSVYVLDAWSNERLVGIPVGEYPVAMTWNWQDSRVYVVSRTSGDSGVVSVVRDVSGVAENTPTNIRASVRTIFAAGSPLRFTDIGCADVYDADGRKAAVLMPGENDVSGLSPGVYTALAQGGCAVRIVKTE